MNFLANDFLIIIFIITGAIVMLLAIVETRKIFALVTKKHYRKGWKILWYLMIFFLFGYGLVIILFLFKIYYLLLFLTGLIFLGGAIFVFLVVKLGFLTIQDLVKSNLYELKLEQEKEHIQAINRAKSLFLGTMSHEILTPMNAILGMTDIVLKSKLNKQQEEQLKIVKNSADNLLITINDILDFCDMESGKIVLEKRFFNFRNFIDKLIELITVKIENKKLSLSYSIGTDIPTSIKTDENRLRQVLLNLINNAIKFTSEGQIKLRVTKQSENEILFEIEDTGIGINNNDFDKLFIPFSQIESSSNRKFEGRGLGLIISQKLVNLMGGKISVKSQLGKGSTFYFNIIVETYSSEKINLSESFNPDHKVDNLPLNILIAEDNKVNQKLALLMFKNLGYSADIAEDGLEVLEKVKQKNYDIIFMDISMPKMDGITATSLILKQSLFSYQKPPIIVAMTANITTEDKNKCFEVGMKYFIPKPTKVENIKQVLNEFFVELNEAE